MTREEAVKNLMDAMQDVADAILFGRTEDLFTGEEDEALEWLLVKMSGIAEMMEVK